jgi:hypothetical protein
VFDLGFKYDIEIQRCLNVHGLVVRIISRSSNSRCIYDPESEH